MLVDGFGREFTYLRLSVTDACNFRCSYCLPDGYQRPAGWQPPLALDELERLVRGFARLGVRKVRLTGGEPTTRLDLVDLVARLKTVPGIETVALSTNGYRLKKLVPALVAAGLDRLNVSVDSLDPKGFARITGHDLLGEVLGGVDLALEAGLKVKANVVLLAGANDDQFDRFLEWVAASPIGVRFIELMRTGDNALFFLRHHSPLALLEERLLALGFARRPRAATDGPAVEFSHPEKRGTVGLIAPYSKDFCVSCNRLRVTSVGALRLCLFGDREVPLRALLGAGSDPDDVAAAVQAALTGKAASHRLAEGVVGSARNLAQMGG